MLSHLQHLWARLLGRPAETQTIAPPALWQAAESRLHFLGHLSSAERRLLRVLTLNFIQSKAWQGAQGLVVTLEMQLEIALQACLLILKRDPREYDGWVEIIIYPGNFTIRRQEMDAAGVVHEFNNTVLGEAWDGGPLLLSWQDVLDGDAANDGINVVIHEFAHKLDMSTGIANGLPRLPDTAARQRWAAAFEPAYTDFCQRVAHSEHTVIDPYAATDPAEFFAVLSEVFFEKPCLLQQQYPDVYSELIVFYAQTPHQTQNSAVDI